MNVKRHAGSGLLALVLGFGVVAAGCGSDTTTKATPLPTVPTSVAPSASAPGATKKPATPTTVAGSGTSPAPTPQQLAAATQELNLAGTSLSGSDTAISGTDVDQSKAQEGSAP